MDNIVTYVDEYFLRAKIKMPFPSVVIESKDMEALALVMQALDPGEVSVIFPYENKFNVIKKKISNSALNLIKLLEVCKFTVYLSDGSKYAIRKKSDLLEVGDWKLS